MRVLVIGGTHFIGPHVVAALDRLGAEITVYHRGIHEPVLPAAVRHVHSPRASVPFLHFPSAVREPAPDVVLHMFPVGEEDARAAVASFAGIAKRVVAISSGDVYLAYGRLLGSEPGPPEPVPLKEDAALREVFTRTAPARRARLTGPTITRRFWSSQRCWRALHRSAQCCVCQRYTDLEIPIVASVPTSGACTMAGPRFCWRRRRLPGAGPMGM